MKHRLGAITALFFCASLVGGAFSPSIAQTPPPPQTPGAVYCKPTPLPYGALGSSTQLNTSILQAASCPVAPGDLWTDGPLSNPTPTFSGSAFTFSPPAMTWYVKGGSVRTPAQTLGPVAANSTSYWWLDSATGAFTGTTLNVAPTASSDLEYTVTSNGSGITGVTNAALTALTIPGGITLGNLVASQCLGTNGGAVISSNTNCLQNISATGPITQSGSSSVQIGCLGTPLACATVVQASAYGVSTANSDNLTSEQNAVNGACALNTGVGAAVVQLPAGVLVTSAGLTQTCGNVVINGQGMGYQGGSGQYPTVIAPGTTLKCKSASSTPLLSLIPTTWAQGGNQVTNIAFDGNSNACQYGLVATGQVQPSFINLSFTGFGTVMFDVAGAALGGGHNGGVLHPYFQNLNFNQATNSDGVGFQFDGTAGSGDVFSAWGGNIFCVQRGQPCIVINRSDHNRLDDLQVVAGSGSTATYSMIVACNSVSFYAGNLLMQNPAYVDGSADCTGGNLVPRGTVFYNYQDYANDAPSPVVGTGSVLNMTDDRGNWFLGANTGGAYTDFMCGGTPRFDGNQNACATGTPVIWPDSTGLNWVFGTRGTPGTQATHIEFCTNGCGLGPNPVSYNSFIDENGCFAFGTVGGPVPTPSASPTPSVETAHFCNGNVVANSTWPAGYVVGIGANGVFTPVPSPSPGGGIPSLNSLTGAISLTSTDSSVSITPSGSTINLQTSGCASACASLFVTPPPNSSFQPGSLGAAGLFGFGAVPTLPPSPTPSESPAAYMYIAPGSNQDVSIANDTDPGNWKNTNPIVFSVKQNNQGTRQAVATLTRGGDLNMPGGSINVGPVAPLVMPSPSCVAGGALAPTTYYLQIAGQTAKGTTAASGEVVVSCGSNTVVQITPPTPSSGIPTWNVYASTTGPGLGSEQLQSNGTSLPFTTTWKEPNAGLAGSGNPPTYDTTDGTVTAQQFLVNTSPLSIGNAAFACTNRGIAAANTVGCALVMFSGLPATAGSPVAGSGSILFHKELWSTSQAGLCSGYVGAAGVFGAPSGAPACPGGTINGSTGVETGATATSVDLTTDISSSGSGGNGRRNHDGSTNFGCWTGGAPFGEDYLTSTFNVRDDLLCSTNNGYGGAQFNLAAESNLTTGPDALFTIGTKAGSGCGACSGGVVTTASANSVIQMYGGNPEIKVGAGSLQQGEIWVSNASGFVRIRATAAQTCNTIAGSALTVWMSGGQGQMTTWDTVGDMGICGSMHATNVFATAFNETGTTLTGCAFCDGVAGTAVGGVLGFGNATSGSGYTLIGAANDGTVAGIQDSALSVSITGTRSLAMDGSENVGVGGKVVAVSGVQPNGSTGSYAPEIWLQGVNTNAHPKMVTGTCASITLTGVACTFPASFAFSANTFTCTFAGEGTQGKSYSYDTKLTTGMTIYANSGTSTVDYICWGT